MVQVLIPADETTPTIVRRAAIIDDAFDDVEEGEITLVQFLEFYQIANEDGNLDAILQRLTIAIPDHSDWNDGSADFLAFLRLLWGSRNDADLGKLIDSEYLFSNKLQKLAQLDELCANIESQKITVQKIKSSVDDLTIFLSGEFVYIFLDYNLGVINGDDAVTNAQKVAKEIYDTCPKEKKPVTILMSSEPNVDSRKEEFQIKAGLLEGVFRFSSKSDLGDIHKVSLLVRAYGEEFYSNHALQEYIQSLIAAGKTAQEEFEKEVKTLRIEDYEFIQNSVLQEQQQPLGDYLAWLYGSHWANLLMRNEKLRKMQEEIDKVISKKAPLHHSLPSPKLSEIFMGALFEEGLEEIKYHPWEGQEEAIAKLPYLHLGDLFTKPADSKVFMIMNPQCDLERPDCKNNEQSIFVVPGKLEALENLPKSKFIKTDFFIFEGKHYRIYWDLKQIKTIPFNEFDKWWRDHELERKFRLRLPFALDIQQRFTSNMSRVGLPVSPPLSRSIPLKVSYKKFDNTVEDNFVPQCNDYSFYPITRDEKKEIRLTLKFALDFKAALIEEHTALLQLSENSKENMPQNLAKTVQKIEGFISTFDDWFFKNRTLIYPKENNFKALQKDAVSITLDAVSFAGETPFLINIITKPVPAIEIEQLTEIEPSSIPGQNITTTNEVIVVGKNEQK